MPCFRCRPGGIPKTRAPDPDPSSSSGRTTTATLRISCCRQSATRGRVSHLSNNKSYSKSIKELQMLTYEIDLVLYMIFFFPGVLALVFYGYDYAAQAWKIKETSWNSPAQINIYMAKTFIPLSGLSLTIQGISEVFRCIICIQTGHWPARSVVAAEETEKMLMRTSQDEDQKDVI